MAFASPSGMIVRTLSEQAVVVQVGGSGDNLHLRVKGEAIARFHFATSDLLQMLEGVPIHLAGPGESVSLVRQGDAVRLAFSAVGHDRAFCSFSARALQEALEEILDIGR